MVSDRRRLSALVPVLNEVSSIKSLCTSLREAGVDEIIIADGGSHDGSVLVAEQCADSVVKSRKGRGHQIAAAAAHATGDVYWIVHSDSRPPPAARQIIFATLSKPGVALGAFPVEFGDAHWALPFFEFCSKFDSAFSTFGDQGFFFLAEDYRAIGGAPEVVLFEDVILRKKLKALGSVSKAPSSIGTSPRRFHQHGLFRQQLLNAYLIVLFHLGVPTSELAALYHGSRKFSDAVSFPTRRRHPQRPAWRPYRQHQDAGTAPGSSQLLDQA